MKLERAVKYLENVQEKKEVIPFRRYAGGIGRSAQGESAIYSKKGWSKIREGDQVAKACQNFSGSLVGVIP